MRIVDMLTLTVVLTLINSVLLGLNIAFTFAIDSTVDRIELDVLDLFLKEGKENKKNAIIRRAFKSGNTHANMKTAYNDYGKEADE